MTSGFIPTLKQPFARRGLRTRHSSSHVRAVAARRLKAAGSSEDQTDESSDAVDTRDPRIRR